MLLEVANKGATMADQLLGVLSGFIKGKSNRAKEERQLELLREQTKARVSAEKLALEREKRLAAKEERESRLLDMFMQQFQGGAEESPAGAIETTPIGESFSQPKLSGRLVDELATGQMPEQIRAMVAPAPQTPAGMGGMSPAQMAVIQKITGIPLVSAAGLDQRKAAESRMLRQGDERNRIAQEGLNIRQEQFNRGFGEGSYQQQLNPAGVTENVWVPKYGSAQQADRPTLTVKKPEREMPIPENDRPFYINPDTMERAPVGMSPVEAEASGFKRVPTAQMEKVQKIEAVKSVLEEVEIMMAAVIPRQEKIGRLGGIARGLSAEAQITESGQQLAVLKDYINANRAQVAKALGEVGNLSESEQEAVVKAFGAITDSGPKAWKQFELLKKTFEKAKNVAFGKQSGAKDVPQRQPGESISDYLKRTQQ